MPGIRETSIIGIITWVVLLFWIPSWAWAFFYGLAVVIGTRLLFAKLAVKFPDFLGLWALGKHLILAGLAIGGVIFGLHPVGVVLGLALWPLGLWLWAARHVRHSR
ncbi:hypothetical protein H5T57_00145 [Candidatus Bipolaricaulota bacterium]|nr:hypothetical protein [Candidatus Bipolaricaulota bacterium]